MTVKNARLKEYTGEHISCYAQFTNMFIDRKRRKWRVFTHVIDLNGKPLVKATKFANLTNQTETTLRRDQWVRLDARVLHIRGRYTLEHGTIVEVLDKVTEPITTYESILKQQESGYELSWEVDEETRKRLKLIIPPKDHLNFALLYPRTIPYHELPEYWREYYIHKKGLDEKEVARRKKYADLNIYTFQRLLLEIDGSEKYRRMFERRIIRHFLIRPKDITSTNRQYKTLLMHFLGLALKLFRDKPAQVKKVIDVFSEWNVPFRNKVRPSGRGTVGESDTISTEKKDPGTQTKGKENIEPMVTKVDKKELPTQAPTHLKIIENPQSPSAPFVAYDEEQVDIKERYGIADSPSNILTLVRRFISDYDQGTITYDKFISETKALMRIIPNSKAKRTLYLKIGNCLAEKGKHKAANRYFKRVLSLEEPTPIDNSQIERFNVQKEENEVIWKKS